jgi:hypothetical protein
MMMMMMLMMLMIHMWLVVNKWSGSLEERGE